MTAGPEVPALEARGLSIRFHRGGALHGQTVRAVDGVDLQLRRGEVLGLVGESGCGKSTLARALLGLLRPASGTVLHQGRDLSQLKARQLRELRRELQVVFQDPYAALDPRMTVGQSVGEGLVIHGLAKGRELQERVRALLGEVGLEASAAARYPYEFSGGQRQRIGIARALAVEPRVVIADEPVSSLDMSIRAQVLNLLAELVARRGLSLLLISHDLAVVRHLCDRVAVMYLGRIVELASNAELYSHPQHPYTAALLSAVPVPDPDIEPLRRRVVLAGDVPNPAQPPSGCRFHPRCPIAQPLCSEADPQLLAHGRPEHTAACHFAEAATSMAP